MKSFVVVVPDAEIACFVVEIVLKDEMGVGIEVDAPLGHEAHDFLIEERAMLYGRTTGEDASARALWAVRVDDGAQPEQIRFSTCRIQLLLAHRRLATVANAR